MKPYSKDFETGLKRAIASALPPQKEKHRRRRMKRMNPIIAVLSTLVFPIILGKCAAIARFEYTQLDNAGLSACLGLLLSLALFNGLIFLSQPAAFCPKFPPFVFPVAPGRLAVVHLRKTITSYLKTALPGALIITSIMMAPLWSAGELVCFGMILLLTCVAVALRLGLFFLRISIPYPFFVGLGVLAFLGALLFLPMADYSIMLQHFLNKNAGWINLLHPGGWISEIWRQIVLDGNSTGFPWLCVPLLVVAGSLFVTLPRTVAHNATVIQNEELWLGSTSAHSSSAFLENEDSDELPVPSDSKPDDSVNNPPTETIPLELPTLSEPSGRWQWMERQIWKRLQPRERMLLAINLKELPQLTKKALQSLRVGICGVVAVCILGVLHRSSPDDRLLIAALIISAACGLFVAICLLPFEISRHVQTPIRPVQDQYPVSYQEIIKIWFRGETLLLALGVFITGVLLVMLITAWSLQPPTKILIWLLAFGLPSAFYCVRYILFITGDSRFYAVSFWWGTFYLMLLLFGMAIILASIVAAPAAIVFILIGKGILKLRAAAWARGTRIREYIHWD